MSFELRKFPRVKVELKIGYEFVNWKEKDISSLKNPIYTVIYDISASGIGLNNLEKINDKIIKELEKGNKKIKLGVFLHNDSIPLITFARFIWSDTSDHEKRYGFLFIDVKEEFFKEIKDFVESKMAEDQITQQ
jgi:c-di-GMP-binding flagellar brake protein YcgR